MSRNIDAAFRANLVRADLEAAVVTVRKSLDATRNPCHPADVPHTYEDKFRVVELASRAALAVQLNTLANGFGLSPDTLASFQKNRGNKTVMLCFTARTSSTFVETKTREEDSATRHETQGVFGKTTYKTVTTITEHFWKYNVQWEVSAFIGAGQHKQLLLSRSADHVVMTRAKEAVNPLPDKRSFDAIEVEITWLLDACKAGNGAVDFSIDRTDATTCHTPRRNKEVDELLMNSNQLKTFFQSVNRQVSRMYHDGYSELLPPGVEKPNFKVIDGGSVFSPVEIMLALEEASDAALGMDESSGSGGGTHDSPATTFSPEDFSKILGMQQQEMKAKFQQLQVVLPREGIVTPGEAGLIVCATYSTVVWTHYSCAVQAVEDMLMSQVIAAIGKHIGASDFANYMNYHNRQLYREEYAPRGFCYAVRRPDHYPEGMLSVENGTSNQPVPTTCLHRPQGHPMKFALSAAIEVGFEGEHYVHSVVFHKFSNSPSPNLKLISRARQFSSFILMVGNLAAADVFQPSHALIIQNKDELKIPLILETIPAPQEFRDAIESLSPEQQAFCRAYRKMQLAGTLFAVAVVQIKPALERLLNLPNDALTKEVKLCQDLMSLFIEYQIPSDLLSYAGPENANETEKLAAVKGYVANIQLMLDKSKQEEIEEAKRRHLKEHPVILENFEDNLMLNKSVSKKKKSKNVSRTRGMKMKKRAAGMPARRSARASAPVPAPAPVPVPAPARTPTPAPAPPAKHDAGTDKTTEDRYDKSTSPDDVMDYTKLPGVLDANFDRFDRFNSLRATTIKLGNIWNKTYQRGLLSPSESKSMSPEDFRKERARAFDLLDALSKSGGLTLHGCTLHVVVAATHCFELNLMNTVVQDNINPIERVEASGLIMASTIFDTDAHNLVQSFEQARIEAAELSAVTPLVES